jgi:hypothetical protein
MGLGIRGAEIGGSTITVTVMRQSLTECNAVMSGKYTCTANVLEEPAASTIISTRLLGVTFQTTAVHHEIFEIYFINLNDIRHTFKN